MPTSPLTSPRFPHSQGFVALSNQSSNNIHRTGSGMDSDADIPLSQIRTGSSMGARKANQGGVGPELGRYDDNVNAIGTDTNEKQPGGLFHSSSKAKNNAAGRRRTKRDATTRHGTGDSAVEVNFMGRLYTKIIMASPVTRYLIYVLPIAALLAVPLVLLPVTGNRNKIPLGHVTTNSTTTPVTKIEGPPLFNLFVWIEVTWVSIWVAKIIAHLLPAVFMFFCGVVSSGTRKYATVLRALEIPFSLFFWGLASWLVFKFLFTDNRFNWIYVIKTILGSLFVSSAVFLIEKAFVQLISISYHNRSFANRIKESKHDIHLIGLMYDASRTLFPMYCPEFAEEDYRINDSLDGRLTAGHHLHRNNNAHQRSGSVTPMRIIGNVGRFGDKVTSVFGNIASEITGKQVFNPNSAHSVVVEALEKVRSSEALARRIWMSFVVEDSDSLSIDDIEEVLGPTHKEEADECFAAIDADGNGDISLEEMIRKVVDIGKERKAIANSMKDIGQALAVFDSVLLFIVLLIVIFIFLAFFQSSFVTTLATAGTALLSLSFVFAVTTQEFLGSCIFLFVKHPYDVGDRVDIQGPEKQQLIVEKISLLFTVFIRIDKMQVVQVPNIALNTLWIENVTRSKAMRETVDISVSFDTSFEDIELLREEMEKFVRHPDNARDFMPDVSISVGGVGDLDKLLLKITMLHKSNWHNDVVRATRRSKFMCALTMALRKVPIYAPGGGAEPLGGPLNPSYSVTVSDGEAIVAREKADKDKDEKRMVPLLDRSNSDASSSSSSQSSPGSRKAEKRAMRDLNAIHDVDGWGVAMDDYNTLNEQSRDSSLDRDTHPLTQTRTQQSSSTHHPRTPKKQMSVDDANTIRSQLTNRSQRGRRQAGQALPPMPLGEDTPAVQVSRYASSSSRRGPSFDLEQGHGVQFATAQQPSLSTVPQEQAVQFQPPTTQQLQPQQTTANIGGAYLAYQPPAGTTASTVQPHPLQSSPMPQAGTGNRKRGASVSQYPRQ